MFVKVGLEKMMSNSHKHRQFNKASIQKYVYLKTAFRNIFYDEMCLMSLVVEQKDINACI